MPRVWLVERDVDSRNLVSLTYATPDGTRAFTRQSSASTMAARGADPTAAVEVDDDRLDPIDDEATRERYATEAERMADRYDPDDEV